MPYKGKDYPDFREAYKRFKNSYETKGKTLDEIFRDYGDWQRRIATTLQRSNIEVQWKRENSGVYEYRYTRKDREITQYRDILTGKFISAKEVWESNLGIMSYDEWEKLKPKKKS